MFLRRTNTGRVVYERPINRFKYSTVCRILRHLTQWYEENDIDNVFLVLSWSISNLSARIVDEVQFQWNRVFSDLAGLPAGQRLLVRLAFEFILLSRKYRSEHGMTTVPWIDPWERIQKQTSSRIVSTRAVLEGVQSDPFSEEMIIVQEQIKGYLEEVGLG